MDVSALHTSDHFLPVSLTTSCLLPQTPCPQPQLSGLEQEGRVEPDFAGSVSMNYLDNSKKPR